MDELKLLEDLSGNLTLKRLKDLYRVFIWRCRPDGFKTRDFDSLNLGSNPSISYRRHNTTASIFDSDSKYPGSIPGVSLLTFFVRPSYILTNLI